jgi:hypothetical protein
MDGAIITSGHTIGVDYNKIIENVPFVFDTKNTLKEFKNRSKIIVL